MATEANIWQPRTITSISGHTKSVEERFIASNQQTKFTLTKFIYEVGTGALTVYKNGLALAKDVDWVEIEDNSIALLGGAASGDVLLVTAHVGITGDVPVPDPYLIIPEEVSTTTRVISIEDKNKLLYCTAEDGTSITIPLDIDAPFELGNSFTVTADAANVTCAGAEGVTLIRGAAGTTLAKYQAATFVKLAVNTWRMISGDSGEVVEPAVKFRQLDTYTGDPIETRIWTDGIAFAADTLFKVTGLVSGKTYKYLMFVTFSSLDVTKPQLEFRVSHNGSAPELIPADSWCSIEVKGITAQLIYAQYRAAGNGASVSTNVTAVGQASIQAVVQGEIKLPVGATVLALQWRPQGTIAGQTLSRYGEGIFLVEEV